MASKLIIRGAREHNLKNIDLDLDKDQLIVISGLSGSGKSSLAFDTIFAEGQRRYVESLSAYARQFLGRLDKPDVDQIQGLSPAIAIEQKSTHKNPRSTVGTITEIYDYYRLLWARIGKPHCPKCGKEISEQSLDQILDKVFEKEEGTKLLILAPVAFLRKGEFKKVFEDAKRLGYTRMRVDNVFMNIDDVPDLDKKFKHTVEVVVDRLILRPDNRQRLASSIETALSITDSLVAVGSFTGSDESTAEYELFSQKNSCPDCGITIPELQPRLFSFNNPYGACPECNGLGFNSEFDIDRIMPDRTKSINEGGILSMGESSTWMRDIFIGLSEALGFSLDTPLCDLDDSIIDQIFYGTKKKIHIVHESRSFSGVQITDRPYAGVITDLRRRYYETSSIAIKAWLDGFRSTSECMACHGKRLRPEALAVTVGQKSIIDVSHLSVRASKVFFSNLELTQKEFQVSAQVLKEIKARLDFLDHVGLGYLTLDRASATLSGGEAQRIRLATQIGSALSGVLYVLDEPSIGLHQRDNQKLIDSLKDLKRLGNTVIVVEHDEDTIRQADYVVDLGPGAGELGGRIIAQGTPKEIEANEQSITGQFLSGKLSIPIPATRRLGNGQLLSIKGARLNNLKSIDVDVPLGKLIVLTGVSGSGKSTLLNQILAPALRRHFNRKPEKKEGYDSLIGLENIDSFINIDQSPIGRTPRSNPATYVEFFNAIRDLYAKLPESKARGYSSGRFSFNVAGGRCETCHGDGTLKIEMHFLPDVYVKCDVCDGKRFNKETLEVKFHGKNIYDVLEMTVSEAVEFFSAFPRIKRKLQTLMSVGLDYIRLGQSALTLSGGEAQRIKLSLELSKVGKGHTFYILDEPTTGLHFADVKKLLEVLNILVDAGNTVILIEHNLDVIKAADYLIDLGPEGGDEGGQVVATGTPEDVAMVPGSYTGQYLKRVLRR